MVRINKILLCGAKQIGKSAILEQLIYGHVTRDSIFHPTIEDTYECHVDTDRGVKELIRFYDLGGITSKNKEIPRHYFNVADAYILVYGINSHESFLIMDSLKKEIDRNKEKKDAVMIVLGNKLDLVEERQVDYSQASLWAAKERVRLFEISVFDQQTLIEPFVYLSSRLNPPPQKSTFPQLSMGMGRSKIKD
ncbi:hypothetical protein GHT06_008676 [Daphnia sinensis]|uniref:NF-kappa-B inhibitor-interacting Ras-like protein 2 n=1 Tax=Daphnia sinensis TaxID=1820382 RepID=A0AAD5LMV1_9CRUS|nr:hypothetical protein GHT06_008676 [Daphnia sinensis]